VLFVFPSLAAASEAQAQRLERGLVAPTSPGQLAFEAARKAERDAKKGKAGAAAAGGGGAGGGGGPDGDLPSDPGADLGVELLRTAFHVEGRYLAIKVFEPPVPTAGRNQGRPSIVFDVVFPLKSVRWTLPVDILGVGLEPGAWEAMPLDEKRSLATHMLDELEWTGPSHDDIRFSFG